MISVETWAEIQHLHRCAEMLIRAITHQLAVGRNTMRRALAADMPPR